MRKKVNNRITRNNKRKQAGFTLIELIVAIGIMLVLAAVATPFLLAHIKDAKVASLNEQILNVKASFDSYFTKRGGILTDSDNDGDYLDEMINEGWLSGDPSKNDLTWTVKSYTDANGKTSYYIEITNGGDDGYAYIHPLASDLDESIDGTDDSTNGRFQYNDDNTNKQFTGYYLLHADPGMNQWHS